MAGDDGVVGVAVDGVVLLVDVRVQLAAVLIASVVAAQLDRLVAVRPDVQHAGPELDGYPLCLKKLFRKEGEAVSSDC